MQKKTNTVSERKSNKETAQLSLVVSYLTIRRTIGILGISFPVILVSGSLISGGADHIQSSISSYYHTNMRDFFVGMICAVALFFFSYKGYDKRDNIAANLGSLFALGTAFLPTSNGDTIQGRNPVIGQLHLCFAALFFLVLIYFSLLLFTKTDQGKKPAGKKRSRNLVYRLCGYSMLLCILLIAACLIFLNDLYPDLKRYNPVFWLESFSLWAFGVSWLTKGEIIWKDVTMSNK